MTNTVLSIVVFAMIVRSCAASIVMKTTEPEGRAVLYEAAIDILMTCYGDQGNAVGVGGDLDGNILKTLRSNYIIPVVLFDGPEIIDYRPPGAKLHRLQSFVIAANSMRELVRAVFTIKNTVFWNHDGNFLIVDAAPDPSNLKDRVWKTFALAKYLNLLNVQFVSIVDSTNVFVFNYNPFTREAPKAWHFVMDIRTDKRLGSLFVQLYKKGGETCKDMNFDKTANVGGYPLYFGSQIPSSLIFNDSDPAFEEYKDKQSPTMMKLFENTRHRYKWFVDHIVLAMNASAVIVYEKESSPDISLHPRYLSDEPKVLGEMTDLIILPLTQVPIIAMTNYTGHKSQLTKILSVIDRTSQIGMCIVYIITFLFFKFFLGEAVVPALMNLVRLTCGTGLTRLPQNVAPTVYLACLFMFVVTMLGIFTGNLATLLTSTIPYPNVETKQDIPRLGYKVYIRKDRTTKFVGDPILEGHIVEIPASEKCENYLLTDPLAACVFGRNEALITATERKVHLSQEPLMQDYIFHLVNARTPFKRRLERIMKTWIEAGLHPDNSFGEQLQLQFVEDDEVKKNVERRVMTMADLGFAFVILGVGLILSFICFIGEIVVWKIRLKITGRREQVRTRLAWTEPEKKFSLKWLFNARRVLSKRR